MTESARGERPRRSLMVSAVMSPVMIMSLSLTIGEGPMRTLIPEPDLPEKPSCPSRTVSLTSLSTAIPHASFRPPVMGAF